MGQRFYTTFISVELAHREIFRDKVGMGGVKTSYLLFLPEKAIKDTQYCIAKRSPNTIFAQTMGVTIKNE